MGWSIDRPTGLTLHRPALSQKGYTLVTPPGDSSYLLDMDGRVVHRWRADGFRLGYARLLPNGRLLAWANDPAAPRPPRDDPHRPPPPLDQHVRRLGGSYQLLLELDWDGTVVVRRDTVFTHHDFVRLPNGHTLVPEWFMLPPDLARRVRGGMRRPREKLPPLLGDDVVEYDEEWNEVWRVRTWELFDPVRDPLCALDRRWEWSHLNGLDVTPQGDIVFSCRNNSRIGIIERATKTLRWKYGAPHTHHQHHATWVDGRVQVFDNGMHGPTMPHSRVIEIDPRTDEITWEYTGNPVEQFFSAHISSAERLPGGNVLVCEGAPGRVFEITRAGEVVWEWVSPFVAVGRTGRASAWIFRAHRYLPDDPALAGHDLSTDTEREFNRLHGLM